jgi:hypothetical protein
MKMEAIYGGEEVLIHYMANGLHVLVPSVSNATCVWFVCLE